jgi:DMSO/TMAO reductase YedYZ heme-binding membrane subunit
VSYLSSITPKLSIYMKKFFKSLFSDNNSINEKSFIGFLSFIMMVVFAIADIITGTLGKELVIQDFIFNSFLWMTLGCFGIASVDKFINKKKDESIEEEAL